MDEKYAAWVHENVTGSGAGLCVEYAFCMALVFPELKAVNGTYSIAGDELWHCWCEQRDGSIVDPTAGQFRTGGTYRRLGGYADFLPKECLTAAIQAAEAIFGRPLVGGDTELAYGVLRIWREMEQVHACATGEE